MAPENGGTAPAPKSAGWNNEGIALSPPKAVSQAPAALILGHPGHELRVLGWLRERRPAIAVLTDGSGHGATSRIDLTTDLVDAAGCRRSALYGGYTDGDFYRAMLDGDHDFYLALAERLAAWLVEENVGLVASDAAEGYNPTHDLCAALAGRAARLAAQRSQRDIAHFTFLLTGPPGAQPAADALVLELGSVALAEKLVEARRYAARAGGALVEEVDTMIRSYGEASFAHEALVPANLPMAFESFAARAPFYETHGEKQVAAGLYQQVIRYRTHVAPIIDALAA